MRRWLAVSSALVAVGCGASSQHADADATTVDAPEQEVEVGPPLTTVGSFDVVAHLTFTGPPVKGTVPESVRFSVTVDPERGLMFAGGGGTSQVVGMKASAGTFRPSAPVSVSVVSASTCRQGVTSVTFDSLALTVNGAAVTGEANGDAAFILGDTALTLPLTATLTGKPDATAPFLISPSGAITDPFQSFEVWPSEPLLEGATARIVGADGSVFGLAPRLSDGDVKLVTAFSKPDLVLPLSGGFQVAVDGLVDLAGHRGEGPLRFGGFAAPPLVDGTFEPGTDTGKGDAGAPIVCCGGLAIDGMGSAFVGPGTMIDHVAGGPRLYVRIARAAAATRVRFSYRIVSYSFPAQFAGTVALGSPGGPVERSAPFDPAMEPAIVSQSNPLLAASDVLEMSIPLSDSRAGELAVMIGGQPAAACGVGVDVGGVGLLVDDLRAE
jgi:hypothetical protein